MFDYYIKNENNIIQKLKKIDTKNLFAILPNKDIVTNYLTQKDKIKTEKEIIEFLNFYNLNNKCLNYGFPKEPAFSKTSSCPRWPVQLLSRMGRRQCSTEAQAGDSDLPFCHSRGGEEAGAHLGEVFRTGSRWLYLHLS
jgi:hypothetical protein